MYKRPTSDTLLVGMKRILGSHIPNAKRPRMAKRGDITLMTRREYGIRGMDHSINPHNSRDATQHTEETRGSLVWLCKKVSLT
jgi:hypothetical protein